MRLSDADVAGRPSHWLQQALAEDRDLAPPLEGEVQADVCVVGGGYMGLWAAIRLADAGRSVVLLERDICGGGPSGRNSGMLLSAWSKIGALAAHGSGAAALEVIRASTEVIGEIRDFCTAEGIDCWFDPVGWVWGATCAAQDGAWNDALARHDRLGAPPPARRVSAEEIAAMTGSRAMISGVFDATAATVHPGFLVRGLRAAALRRGVRIHERSAMTGFTRRGEPRVTTSGGTVRAGHLVLAVNAHAAGIPELAPAIFNIASDDCASAPMPEALEAAGYARGPLMIDSRVFVAGWRVTRDGRLNAGVTGGAIGFGGRVDRRFDAPSPRVEAIRTALRFGHPALADFPLATAWRGAIDRTASGLPLFGRFAGNPRILYGYGFSGNGIGMTCLGGRLIADMIMERDNPLIDTPLLRPIRRGFPPEPFRFLGAHVVRHAVRAQDRAEQSGRRPAAPWRMLAGLAPSGVTPSKANIKEDRP